MAKDSKSEDEYARRKSAYRALKSLDLPILFPFGVDCALDYMGPSELRDYVKSRAYLAACKCSYRKFRKAYRVREWTLETIRSGQLADGTLLVDLWAQAMVHRCERELRKIGQPMTDRDNVVGQFRATLITKLDAFKVGRIVGGKFIANSFGKFLNFTVYWKVQKEVEANLRASGLFVESPTETIEAIAEEPSEGSDWRTEQLAKLAQCMSNVVRLQAATTQTLEIFYHLVYRGETTRSLVGRYGAHNRAVGRQMTPIRDAWLRNIVTRWNADLRTLSAFRFNDYGRLFAYLVTEKLFVELVATLTPDQPLQTLPDLPEVGKARHSLRKEIKSPQKSKSK